MPTEAEELQAKEFLKRAEVRTMKKDLSELRESDALKERDKIARLKTLEEQLEEKKKTGIFDTQSALAAEKTQMQEVLEKGALQEKVAEKDLKNYATEEERQKIFLFESERFSLEKQSDEIDKQKDPALKLEKNNLLIKKGDWQKKLDSIIENQRKIEAEQRVIIEQSQITTIASQRKGLEDRRWELDKNIKNLEKQRWEAEKAMQDIDEKVNQINKSSDLLVTEKNSLRDKILGIDKSLREIYSVVMAREEEKRKGQAQEQLARKDALAKARGEQQEKTRREQWAPVAIKNKAQDGGYLSKAPEAVKKRLAETAKTEEEMRKKFLQDVDNWSGEKGVSPVQRASVQAPPSAPTKK